MLEKKVFICIRFKISKAKIGKYKDERIDNGIKQGSGVIVISRGCDTFERKDRVLTEIKDFIDR